MGHGKRTDLGGSGSRNHQRQCYALVNMETLETRLIKFLSNYHGAESIDSLMELQPEEKRRRADFLSWNRNAIVEIKSLKNDPSSKIEAEIKKHESRPDFPLCYGKNSLSEILKCLPDGDKINRKIFGAITRSVEDAVRSAEEQIAHTKEIFRIQNPIRFLILVNESVSTLRPEDAGTRIAKLMLRERTGKSESPTIDVAWLVFESHTIRISPNLNCFVSMLIKKSKLSLPQWFCPAFEDLQAAWANHNYGAIIQADVGNPTALDSQTSRAEKAKYQSN